MSTALEQINLQDDAPLAGCVTSYAFHEDTVNVIRRVNCTINDGKVLLIGTSGQIVREMEADHEGLFCGYFSEKNLSHDWPFRAYHFDPARNVAAPVEHDFLASTLGGVVME
jgi:hypothetical protein